MEGKNCPWVDHYGKISLVLEYFCGELIEVEEVESGSDTEQVTEDLE